MKNSSIKLFLILGIVLFFISCVNVFKYSDLRPEGYAYPNDNVKAKQLLTEMGVAHRNNLWDILDTYNVKFEEESFGFFGKKSSPFKELKMEFSINYIPKTFNGLMEILSGDEKGVIWGVQDGTTYQKTNDNIVIKENDKYEFSINTYQYFIELPNRITEATVIDYAGTKNIEGIKTEGIIASWGTVEPQKNIDQYVIWLDAKTKRIVKVDYTIREKFKFVRGEAFYSDYKDFNGYLLPTKIESKSNIKKDGFLHVKKINEFTPNLLSVDVLKPIK